jgi:rhodanese-related sulfurtransferase
MWASPPGRGWSILEWRTAVPQKITTSVKSMVEAAKREIEEIEAADAVKVAGRDDVVLVDLRDPRELERDGKVPGAFRMTRGMLEFWIDPESPYFKPVFGEDKKFVFFCAGGLRSALAAKTAQDMGLKPVAHILGGFKAWKEAGGPVEGPELMPGEGKRQKK